MTLLETRASSSPSMLVAWWMKPRHCISCRNSDFSGAVMSVGTSSTAISSAAASFMVKWRMPPMRADQPGVTDIPASRTPRDALGSMQATTVTSWWQRIMDGARAASRELHERRVREVSTKRREPTSQEHLGTRAYSPIASPTTPLAPTLLPASSASPPVTLPPAFSTLRSPLGAAPIRCPVVAIVITTASIAILVSVVRALAAASHCLSREIR